jgi:hypothetical protein
VFDDPFFICNISCLACDFLVRTQKKETAMRKIFFLTSLVTFLFTTSIWAADISGTWVLKYQGHSGDERVLDMVIAGAGENLTVAMTHPSLGEMAGTGALKGNDITLTLAASGEKKIGFELKGTVTGNKMAGTREVKMPERDQSEGARGGDQSGGQRGAKGESSDADQGGSKREARGEASGGTRAEAKGGETGKAPESDSSKAKETSNTWTAEKK